MDRRSFLHKANEEDDLSLPVESMDEPRERSSTVRLILNGSVFIILAARLCLGDFLFAENDVEGKTGFRRAGNIIACVPGGVVNNNTADGSKNGNKGNDNSCPNQMTHSCLLCCGESKRKRNALANSPDEDVLM